jgi:rRNA processing protein Krr1/Pno1
MQIMVPDRTVGLIIGRGGETIRDLQERSGCHVNIVGEQKSVNGLRPVNLIGSREAAAKAKDLIMEIVESDSKSAATKDRVPASRDGGRDPGYGGGFGGAVADKINDSIFVPSEAVGMIIGKGGETIKDMQATTGCKINVSPSSGPGEVEREIGLVGSRDAIAAAKRAIEDKVEAVVSPCFHCLNLTLTFGRHRRTAAAAAEVPELAPLKTIMEIERTPNLRMLSHKDNSKPKHQHKLLPPLAPRTLMQPVRSQF